jgi:hypothetical protein
MFTAADLEGLTEAQRFDRLNEIATRVYETPRYGAALARDIGYDRRTVQGWRGGKPIPDAVLLLLMHWDDYTDSAVLAARKFMDAAKMMRRAADMAQDGAALLADSITDTDTE